MIHVKSTTDDKFLGTVIENPDDLVPGYVLPLAGGFMFEIENRMVNGDGTVTLSNANYILTMGEY